MLAALPTLKELAFMVLLTRAGLHIEPDALNALTIALGTLPVTMDALGIALTTMLWKKWSFLEAIVLGVLCAGCGDGLVLPKQREMLDKGFGLLLASSLLVYGLPAPAVSRQLPCTGGWAARPSSR